MSFKKLAKKVTSYLAASAICAGLIFSSAPTPAEAFGIGDAINVGSTLLGGSVNNRLKKKSKFATTRRKDGKLFINTIVNRAA